MESNDLLFLSGNDLPFPEARITIHQPTIKEIGYIGEETFYMGLELINFSKNILPEEDKIHLETKTNFDVLIAILKERNAVMQKNRNCIELVLALMFPLYEINFTDKIELTKEGETRYIDNSNFELFVKIVNEMFSFKNENFNPSGDMAKSIADKLKKRHEKLNQIKNNDSKKIDILSRYVSILAIGQQKDMNSLLQYTVYQLFDEFKRYELKMNYDIYISAKMAGAKDLKEVEDWMQDIHQ